jgi:acetyl esterase/lipase
MTRLLALLLLMLGGPAYAQDTIPVWPNGAPGSEARRGEAEIAAEYWARNIHNPSLTIYRPEPGRANGAAVVILPGGGHRLLVIHPEGTDAARFFTSLGLTAFVLKYRLAREEGSTYTIEGDALADTRRAVRLVREHAAEWGIDPRRIGLMGFSAGGELVTMAADGPGGEAVERPDFQILVYPGPLGIPDAVPPGTPPAFLVAANDDECCSAPTLALLTRLRAAHVPAELHLYAQGAHGFNMGQRTPLTGLRDWPRRLAEWMADTGLLRAAR